MSAYVVSVAHIAAIVRYGVMARNVNVYHPDAPMDLGGTTILRLTYERASQVGQLLLNENHASVNYRYEEHKKPPVYYHTWRGRQLSAVEAIKACDCLDYQCSEHPDWGGSLAKAVLTSIREAAIGHLPGYEEAPWEIPADATEAATA